MLFLLQSSLQERVSTSIAEAHAKFSVAILEDWMYGPFSNQSILVSLFITWTLEVEMVIAQCSEDWSSQLKALLSLRLRWQQQIDRIANTLGTVRRSNNRMLTTCMIIVLTYFRDVLSSLLELPMFQGPADYNWSKVTCSPIRGKFRNFDHACLSLFNTMRMGLSHFAYPPSPLGSIT